MNTTMVSYLDVSSENRVLYKDDKKYGRMINKRIL